MRAAQPIPDVKPVDRKFFAAMFRAEGIERDFLAGQLISEKRLALEREYQLRLDSALASEKAAHKETVKWAFVVTAKLEALGIPFHSVRWREEQFVRAVKHALSTYTMGYEALNEKAAALEGIAKRLRFEAAIFASNSETTCDEAETGTA